MLIHPSGKLFNPQKSKAKDRSARNHNPCSRINGPLKCTTIAARINGTVINVTKGIANRFAINEVRLMP